MSNQLDDKMLLTDCINDITQSAINTQVKLVDKYLENFFDDFELKKDDQDNEYYVPKKLVIKNEYNESFEISKTTFKNNNHLSLKDFNVSGKFKVLPKNNKFFVDFKNDNMKGLDLDISLNLGKIDKLDVIDDINNMINKLSEGKKI
tara:strand:- start:132 stop:572 length:441 start_codon:yes stop_codon:yes gene_type:complete